MSNYHPWRIALIVTPMFFVAGFLTVLGMKLANQLVAGDAFNQSLSLHQLNRDNFFMAQGEATITSVPDQVSVDLGLTTTATSVQQVRTQANQIMSSLNEKLLSLGLDKKNLKTTRYSLYPNYDWQSSNRRITGYSLDTNLEVTMTDFELLNQVIDTASNLGINQIGAVTFSTSTAKKNDLKNQARAQAIEQAKNNAEQLANLAGVRLGQIVNVYESEDYPDGRDLMSLRNKAMAEMSAGEDAAIEAGQSEYLYRVNLEYILQ